MATNQQYNPQGDMAAPGMSQGGDEYGTGPDHEYEYPTTQKDEPIPVMSPSMVDAELTTEDPAKAPAEGAPPLEDADINHEEDLENAEAGEWSEDLAENKPRPGEEEEFDPDMEFLPSDRG